MNIKSESKDWKEHSVNKKDNNLPDDTEWYECMGNDYSIIADDYYSGQLTPATEQKKCECGSESAGVGGHSTWCPKFEDNR